MTTEARKNNEESDERKILNEIIYIFFTPKKNRI